MSKENMPKVLPKTLPAGTKFSNGFCSGELTGEARLFAGHAYEGPMSWIISGTDVERTSAAGNLHASYFDWSGSAPTDQSASWVPKAGDRVRVCAGRYEGLFGTLDLSLGETRPCVFWEHDRCYYPVRMDELEPAPTHNAFTDDGAKERTGAGVHVTNGYIKKPDPYTTHAAIVGAKADFYEWQRDQNQKHAAMLAQAKAELDRPVRTGALKNRDRYGQKLSLRGWSTDESKP